MNNYHGAMDVFVGLQNPNVERLKRSWLVSYFDPKKGKIAVIEYFLRLNWATKAKNVLNTVLTQLT
jgi:hypothetical protein